MLFDRPRKRPFAAFLPDVLVKFKLYRLFFWTLWFVVIPLGLATTAVSLLDSGETAIPEGLFGSFRYFVQNQKVPAIIVFFVAFEMLFYQLRYSLPFVERLGIAGRSGLPKSRRREFEQASQLLEDTQLTMGRHAKELEKKLTPEARTELDASLASLRAAMSAPEFSVAAFDEALEGVLAMTARHLGGYQRGEVREYGESIFIAVAIALGLRAFVVEAFQIPSGSMLPTLQLRDHIFVNKFTYGPSIPFTKNRLFSSLPPNRGDIVVFEYPDPNLENPRQDYIKRVMALPGDILEVEGGHPIINGWAVPSCKVGEYSFTSDYGSMTSGPLFVEFLGDLAYLTMFEGGERLGDHQGPYRVKEGEFWVLGDNRNSSSDSRAWRNGVGAGVPFENVKGRAMFVWLSFNRTGQDPLGVTWDRLLTNVMGHPRLPKEAAPELKAGIERCLATRPLQTVPPAPSDAALRAAR